MPKSPLAKLRLTNGEGGMVSEIEMFLNFMRYESAPVPADREEQDVLVAKYVKAVRNAQMQYVSDLRVSRGESPLPAKLLKGGL